MQLHILWLEVAIRPDGASWLGSALSGSLGAVSQQSGQEEDGLLSDVSPGAQFGLPVLLQSHVPALVLVLLRHVGVVVVLL